jgi:hypothetical protein
MSALRGGFNRSLQHILRSNSRTRAIIGKEL